MKILFHVTAVCIMMFYSCDEFHDFFPQSTFDSGYPLPNLNIEKEIGSYVVIKSNNDTLYLRISSAKDKNTICDLLTGDTLFTGKVALYKGLYYFTLQITDTSYWIYAVKRDMNLIYGITEGHAQALLIDKEILKGNYPGLVRSIDTAHHSIRLHPEVEQLNRLLIGIVNNMVPDTIIYSSGGTIPFLNKNKAL